MSYRHHGSLKEVRRKRATNINNFPPGSNIPHSLLTRTLLDDQAACLSEIFSSAASHGHFFFCISQYSTRQFIQPEFSLISRTGSEENFGLPGLVTIRILEEKNDIIKGINCQIFYRL